MSDSFSVKNLYSIINWGGLRHVSLDSIWKSAAPKKCKVFAWLLSKGRIKVRSVLLRQNIVNDDSCPFGCNARETVEHFALDCAHSTQILALLGIDLAGLTDLSDIFDAARDRCADPKKESLGSSHYRSFVEHLTIKT
jgi:hypothetical protein